MDLNTDRLFRNATGALVALVLVALMLPGSLLAHAELETATPADKSTVAEPVEEVSGEYSEAMTPDGSSLIVKDLDGNQVAKGTVDPEDDKRMVATPASPLGNGTYAVQSTAVATDGHIEHATWTFTVAVTAAPTPTAVPTVAPSIAPSGAPTPTAVPPTPSPAPSVAPVPSPSGGDGSATGGTGDVLLPIIVALVILGAGAAYLLTRRNRPTDAA